MWISTIIDKGDFGREICRYATDNQARAHEIGYAAAHKLDGEREGPHDYVVAHVDYLA